MLAFIFWSFCGTVGVIALVSLIGAGLQGLFSGWRPVKYESRKITVPDCQGILQTYTIQEEI